MAPDSSSSIQDAFWATVFVLVIGFNLLSALAISRRLKEWAAEANVKIVKKSREWKSNAPKWFHQRAIGCYYLTLEDRERHVFHAWIKVGGLLAVLFGKKPKVVWDNLPVKIGD